MHAQSAKHAAVLESNEMKSSAVWEHTGTNFHASFTLMDVEQYNH